MRELARPRTRFLSRLLRAGGYAGWVVLFDEVRMRQYVRAWINAWDLVRLDPAHVPDTEVLDVISRYDEDQALEQG